MSADEQNNQETNVQESSGTPATKIKKVLSRSVRKTSVGASHSAPLAPNVSKPQSSNRGIYLLSILCVILLGVGLLWYFMYVGTRTANSRLWVQLVDGRNIRKTILEDFPEKKQADIVRYQFSHVMLWDNGVKSLNAAQQGMVNSDSFKFMKFARDQYEELYTKYKDNPVLGGEALYNMAVALESMAAEKLSNLKEAKRTYEQVAEEYPSSVYARMANERLEFYKDPAKFAQLEEFYAQMNFAELQKRQGLGID